ncbi:MBL fold metallo-hydrolase [Bacillus suaedaesalsae]|uniref:MBL fold metallo-hydrolase n=1 Tax=Bacillus suaedaesalsae TaxID=2810349 RepID=A0ABS2DFD1_9BACI|nr:MBL fold metallo-hydrolase [Bacillus suaedaesalsae]MBM6617183.1 MBL fold metallo-hydrolase [Bacillus suaedaesalsae]
MKLTVIGYWGGFPGKNEATSGYLLEEDNFRLLIDCGSGVISQLQNYIQPEELDAVILSHYHNDHVSDIGALQYARLIKGYIGISMPTLPIYGHKEDQEGFKKLTYNQITKGITYNPNIKLEIGPFSITFLKTKHPVTCYAMRIEISTTTIVYTADSSFKEDFIPFCKNADLLICECNLYAGMDGTKAGHMTSEDAGRLAQEANITNLLLTHLPHFGEHGDLVEQAKTIFKGNVSLASSGLSFEFK